MQATEEVLQKIVTFLRSLGFTMTQSTEPLKSFLPGIVIEKGMEIRFYPPDMKLAGDLLHEAGHIAITPSIFRQHIYGDIDAAIEAASADYVATHEYLIPGTYEEDPVLRGLMQSGEPEAIAWSYAAAIHLDVDLKHLFNGRVRRGFGVVRQGLQAKAYFGINGMQAAGMTSRAIFPNMCRWLQH